jgi:hypothetical protein
VPPHHGSESEDAPPAAQDADQTTPVTKMPRRL